MGRQGKIARLPAEVREALNKRLLDGEGGRKILDWLNGEPRVKSVLEEDFEGLRVNDQNLSDWRQGGYQDWCKQRERIDRTKELARYAAQQARANGATIADGAAAVASGKLLELLELVDSAVSEDEDDNEDEKKKTPVENVAAIAYAIAALKRSEQRDTKLELDKKVIGQRDQQLELERDKFQRSTCNLFLKWYEDRRAVEIVSGGGDNTSQIEQLGQLMFGETWKPAAPPGS